MSEAEKIIPVEEWQRRLQERLPEGPPIAALKEQDKAAIENLVIAIVAEGLQALERVQDGKLLEMEARMQNEVEALRGRVAELEAEKALREQEERERAYFSVGDDHLFGNRLRWAGRVLKYWWDTRIRHA